MAVSMEQVKELRERTQAGILECRNALQQADGDINKALLILREKGLEVAAKKATREVREGRIETYIHTGNRGGAIVEINCETDFVARTADFQKLAKDIAMHIAGLSPRFLTVEEIPAEEHEEAKREHGDNINNYYKEHVLNYQSFVRDPQLNVSDLINQAKAKLGENIVIRRFVRYELGK